MGRRQALHDIHEGVGLSQDDIEHLRQVYISACLSGLQRTPNIFTQSHSYEMNQAATPSKPNLTSRQRSVPAVLNELSMDSRLIKFLETKGFKGGSVSVVKIPADDVQRDESDHIRHVSSESNFIDMLTRKLAEHASLEPQMSEVSQPGNFTDNDSTTPGRTQRRLDRLDILGSPRFRQRRNALANIMDSVDIRQLKTISSLSMDFAEPVSQLAVPEATQKKTIQMSVSLAF